MNSAKHILNTWLLALVWFPFFAVGFTILMTNEIDAISLMPFLYLFGFLFSLPALFLCFLGMRLLLILPVSYEARFMIWLAMVMGSVLAGAVAICVLLFDLHFLAELLPFIFGAMVAGGISVGLRFRQFTYFIHKKTKEYENNLV